MSMIHFFSLIFFLKTTTESDKIFVKRKLRMKGHTTGIHGYPILYQEALERGMFDVIISSLVIDLYVSTYVSEVYIRNTTDRNITIRGTYRSPSDILTNNCGGPYFNDQLMVLQYNCSKIFRDLTLTGYVNYSELTVVGYSTHFNEYMGCFRLIKSTILGVDECNCTLSYVGYNKNRRCFCVSSLNNTQPVPLSNCDAFCTNLAEMRCGNGNYYSVYYTGEELVYARSTLDCYQNYTEECKTCPTLHRKGINCEIFGCLQGYEVCDSNMICQSEVVNNYLVGICQCREGYYRKNLTECADINECALFLHHCGSNSRCLNLVGYYECECYQGYNWTDELRYICIDIDECLTNSCGNETTATCSNTIGTFSCTCKPGYFNSTPTTCLDIDECLTNPCFNETTATCSNTPGTFSCTCKPGYFSITPTTCSDVDECLTNACTNAKACVNTGGQFYCDCNPGFDFIEREKDCKDSDECSLEHPCDSNTTRCLNTPGSYLCDCNLGFLRFTSIKCSDIDECESYFNTCGEKSVCRNIFGSFICECPEGSTLNKFEYLSECEDIDECAGVHECVAVVSFCLNLFYGYYCQCRTGYINIDNHTCEINPQTWNMTTQYGEEDFMTTESALKINVPLLTLYAMLCLTGLTCIFFILYKVFLRRRGESRESSTLTDNSIGTKTSWKTA